MIIRMPAWRAAHKAVDRARPPVPKDQIRIRFKRIFNPMTRTAIFTGVFESWKE